MTVGASGEDSSAVQVPEKRHCFLPTRSHFLPSAYRHVLFWGDKSKQESFIDSGAPHLLRGPGVRVSPGDAPLCRPWCPLLCYYPPSHANTALGPLGSSAVTVAPNHTLCASTGFEKCLIREERAGHRGAVETEQRPHNS